MPTPTQISRAIADIERPYPPDDLIKNYRDFLKLRDVLPFYQYNPKVLAAMVDILCNLWYSEARISRLSLITIIKQYGRQINSDKVYDGRLAAEPHRYPLEATRQLCWVFQRCFDRELPVNHKQAESIKANCNSLLIGAAMSGEEEKWLCRNLHLSPVILNRILRYPVPSSIISEWARANYNNDNFRDRRAEMAGWLLDENPEFVVDEQTLIADFEYLNKKDKAAIGQYNDEMEAQNIVDKELGSLLRSPNTGWSDGFNTSGLSPGYFSTMPQLELTKRFYQVPVDDTASATYGRAVPNFKTLTKIFHENIRQLQSTTMLWAVNYSRLDKGTKEDLLKKHFCQSSAKSFFKIAKKLQSVNLLLWLKDQME